MALEVKRLLILQLIQKCGKADKMLFCWTAADMAVNAENGLYRGFFRPGNDFISTFQNTPDFFNILTL